MDIVFNIIKKDCTTQIIKHILEKGANINIQNEYGDTALLFLSSFSDENDIEIARLLLMSREKNDVNVNIQNNYGCTAIMSQLLLEYDATPCDTQDINIFVNNIAKLNVLRKKIDLHKTLRKTLIRLIFISLIQWMPY